MSNIQIKDGDSNVYPVVSIVLSKTISGKTDSTGDINLALDSAIYYPLAFRKSSPTNVFFTYCFGQETGGQGWWMKMLNDSAGNLGQTDVTGTLYYMRNP